MKYFVVIAIICASIAFSEQGSTKEQRIEMFKGLVNNCAAKEGASAADVDEALTHKMPSTQGGKCLQACIGETLGIIKDNKANVEGSIALAKQAYDGDAAKVKLTTDMANDCISVTDPERCEAASKLVACGKNSAEAHGVNWGDW